MAHLYQMESEKHKYAIQVFTKSARIVTKDNKGKYTNAGKVFWLKQPMDFDACSNLIDMLDQAYDMGKAARSQEFANLLGKD